MKKREPRLCIFCSLPIPDYPLRLARFITTSVGDVHKKCWMALDYGKRRDKLQAREKLLQG